MSDDELVERMAEALWQAESERAGGRRRLIPWEEEGADMQNWWRIGARAALAVAEPVIRERECAAYLARIRENIDFLEKDRAEAHGRTGDTP